jgi:hypothetical protein
MDTLRWCLINGRALLGIFVPLTTRAQSLAHAKDISRDLGAEPIPSDISITGPVDPSLPPLLVSLKREIRQWASAELASLPANIDVAQFQKSVVAELDRAGLIANPNDRLRHQLGKILKGLRITDARISLATRSCLLRWLLPPRSLCSFLRTTGGTAEVAPPSELR